MILPTGRTLWTTALAAGVCLAALPRSAAAQNTWSFQGRVGVAVPAGDLGDTHDPGVTFGGGLARWMSDALAIRADVDVDELDGGSAGPDLTLWHVTGGVELDLIQPGGSPWKLHANAGAGITSFDPAGEGGARDDTELTLAGGLRLGYQVTAAVSIFGGGQGYLMFTEDATWSFPITAGFRVLLPGR